MKELIAIQSELKAPKNQTNKFGGYKYRSCEDILEAVKPFLTAHECLLFLSDEITEVGGRIYVTAVATFTNKEGIAVSVRASAREEETKKGMDASQITGSASSYARKYALNGLFLIDDTKEADATNDHGKNDGKDEKQNVTQHDVFKLAYNVKTKAELADIWKKYPQFQKDDEYNAVFKQIKDTLKI